MEQDDIDKLELLAYDEHAIGSAQARAQLALVKEIVYPMDLDVEINHPRSTKDEIQKTIKIPFSVQPIPANQTVWLTYPYYSGMEKVSLSVLDVMGREIFHQEMSQLNGLYELNTSNWGSGFYLAEIIIDGISLGVQKLEIQH